MSFDPGQWAEKQAKDWMDGQSNKVSSFVYHRYPDAKAARGALSAQPADYLVSTQGRILHLEIKETKELNRLPKAKVRQYGMLQKWWWGNVAPYVVVYRSVAKDWTYLSSAELFGFDECPASFDMTSQPKFSTAADVLSHLFA